MADAVLSVRIDEGLKQRFIELAQENGINNKDLMQLLVAQFELEQVKQGKVQFSQDIDELQRLTKRIADIYLNMVERVQLQALETRNKESEALEEMQKEMATLKEALEQAKKEKAEHQRVLDELRVLKQDVKKNLEEQKTVKDLNELLRQKNNQLEKEAADREGKLSAADQVLQEVAQLKGEVSEKSAVIQRLTFKIDAMEEEKMEKHQHYTKKELEMSQKLAEQLTFLKRQHQLELQELKLQSQLEAMEQMDQLKVAHRERVEELLEEKRQLQIADAKV